MPRAIYRDDVGPSRPLTRQKRALENCSSRHLKGVDLRVYLTVAETAMGKPPFKASDGGQMDILREGEEVTQSELQQGSGTHVL
jgi:hypothetical protein